MLLNNFSEYEVIFKCLLVDEETILKRDLLRDEDCRMNERCLVLLKEFIDCNYPSKYIIDSSNLTIEETVDKIYNESI